MVSSMSACRKAPGMSVTTTYLHSLVSIAHDIVMASNDMLGEFTSSLVVYSYCDLPSAHPCNLMVRPLFFLMNIKYLSALLLSALLRLFFISFNSASLECSLFSSFSSTSLPFCPNLFMPALMHICVINTCSCSLV